MEEISPVLQTHDDEEVDQVFIDSLRSHLTHCLIPSPDDLVHLAAIVACFSPSFCPESLVEKAVNLFTTLPASNPIISRLQAIRSRLSASGIRTSFRRSSSASTSSASSYSSYSSTTSSPVSAINAVLFRQPSIADLEEEKRRSGPELSILEPRPIVYWGGVEERIGIF
ncbi:hypothetical protein GGS23DRAFT_610456 [Durotheca rogersii]|uniref:uncharacterized protein n=1 Tax=Durotheca rogersii TaxID=419775 RepID=UPI002220402B|nr:uncharacterized protein GGS23DRAFT_610456 [Durotheca rogersii]KAI5862712.1 hypothetical protein GGS23DRAFT_610456 [Durotheca rogersii]